MCSRRLRNRLANQAMDQTPHRAARASLAALVIAERYPASLFENHKFVMGRGDSLGWGVDGFARGGDSIGLGAGIVYGNCEHRARSLFTENR